MRRTLNVEAVARTFKQLWRSRNGFKIKDLGNNILLFIFDNKLKIDKVFVNEPWSFDKHLGIIQRYNKVRNIHDLDFKLITFWMQVHDIPIRFMNREVVEGIC